MKHSNLFRLPGFLLVVALLILAFPVALFLGQRSSNQQQAAADGARTQTVEPRTPIPGGHTYYVSKKGSNSDGLSWATAWNELNQINWSKVQPGDVILLDGGSKEMVYTTALTFEKSGTATAPVTVERATEAGRNGKVVIFGGRSTPLPYCGQTNYTYQTTGVLSNGVVIGDAAWIIFDGMRWGGISIYGYNYAGMSIYNKASNDTIRNVEIYDNGYADQGGDGTWSPDGKGVAVSGSDITFEHVNIYDNGTDAFQSGGLHNFTVRRSWLHITREDPRQPGLPFNQCRHQDGLQIWGGGIQTGILIEDSILGPGLKEGTILGQTPFPGNNGAVVNNVTIRNTLFTNKVINIMGYSGMKEQNWTIDHVTVFSPGNAIGIWLEGSGHVVTNSIFYSGQVVLPDGLASSSGNCQWQTTKNTSTIVGQTVDPMFVDNVAALPQDPPLAQIANTNFALQAASPCAGKGSSVTSVAQLISMV